MMKELAAFFCILVLLALMQPNLAVIMLGVGLLAIGAAVTILSRWLGLAAVIFALWYGRSIRRGVLWLAVLTAAVLEARSV